MATTISLLAEQSSIPSFPLIHFSVVFIMVFFGSFFCFCPNETVNGFEFDFETFPWHLIPKDMPVVCDMSSNIGTKNVPYDKLAMIYMGA